MLMNLFLLLSIIFFIIAHIFLFIQGIFNLHFYNFNDRKIIVERTLYEQFSYEVYSSINSSLSVNNNIQDKCDNNEILINLNLDTFFDCRGIFNIELESCKNKIVNNNTNCIFPEAHIDYETDLDNLLYYDPRITYCKYYSKFKQKLKKFFNSSICQTGTKFSYEVLLNNSVNERDFEGRLNPCPENYKKCGILDTKRNLLCISSYNECPKNNIKIYEISESAESTLEVNVSTKIKFINNNSRDIVKSIILSENIPLSHEWDLIVRETYEELDDANIEKRRNLTSEDFKLLNLEADKTYQLINIEGLDLKVKNVKDNNIIKDYNTEKYNEEQNLNIYTRNYIGFKNYDELHNFKTIFKNYTDNPLYKLSTSKHHPLITIIIPIFFLAISIAYLVLQILKILQDSIYQLLFYVFIIFIILFCLAELITISVHFYKYPQIYIDMDDRMKKVLDLYNKRTVMSQIFRIMSLIFNVASLIFAILYYFKKKSKIFKDYI